MSSDTTRRDSTCPDSRTQQDGSTLLSVTKPEPCFASERRNLYRPGELLLDTYEVKSEPLQGGMGSVWRVHHLNWNVDLAMKRPRSRVFQTREQMDNFTQECSQWIRLGLHPNIVSCYYVREIDGIPSIFSEWVEDGTLSEHIRDGTVYAGTDEQVQERLLDIALQFARGLHFAHERGLIHQDVKPDNLLLTSDWTAKVSDFGLARARSSLTVLEGEWTIADAKPDTTVVMPSGACTPAYCSPEQAGTHPLGRGTDIYSWAVSVLELYLGCKPWAHGRDCTGPLAGIACRDYFAMSRVPMPEALCQLLETCLAQDPEERPRDFTSVETELLAVYAQVTGSPYQRSAPMCAADTADELNNRALSYLDLDDVDAALACWDKALALEGGHHAAVFNRTVARSRLGLLQPWAAEAELRAIQDEREREKLAELLRRELRDTVVLPDPVHPILAKLCSSSADGRLSSVRLHCFPDFDDPVNAPGVDLNLIYDRTAGRYCLFTVHSEYCRRSGHAHSTYRSEFTLSEDGRFAAYDVTQSDESVQKTRFGRQEKRHEVHRHTVVVDLARCTRRQTWLAERDRATAFTAPAAQPLREFEHSEGMLSPDGSVIAFPSRWSDLARSDVLFYDVASGAPLGTARGAVLLGFLDTLSPVLYTAAGELIWGGTAQHPLAAKHRLPCALPQWWKEPRTQFRQLSGTLAVVKTQERGRARTGLLLHLHEGRAIASLRWAIGENMDFDSCSYDGEGYNDILLRELGGFQLTADGAHLVWLTVGFPAKEEHFRTETILRTQNLITAQVWDTGSGRLQGQFYPFGASNSEDNHKTLERYIADGVNVLRHRLLACRADPAALRYCPEHRADYLLSVVSSTERRMDAEQRYRTQMERARRLLNYGVRKDALQAVDEALRCPGFGADLEALRLRAEIGRKLNKRMVRQIIPLSLTPTPVSEPAGGPDWEALAAAWQERLERAWPQPEPGVSAWYQATPGPYSDDARYRLLYLRVQEAINRAWHAPVKIPWYHGVAVVEADTGRTVEADGGQLFLYPSQYKPFHAALHVSRGELWLLTWQQELLLRRMGTRRAIRLGLDWYQSAALLHDERFLLARREDGTVQVLDLTGGVSLRRAFPKRREKTAAGACVVCDERVDAKPRQVLSFSLPDTERGPLRLLDDHTFAVRRGEREQVFWMDWDYNIES